MEPVVECFLCAAFVFEFGVEGSFLPRVSPEVFDGVEFWRVFREGFDLESRVVAQKVLDESRFVDAESVHEKNDALTGFSDELFEEFDEFELFEPVGRSRNQFSSFR